MMTKRLLLTAALLLCPSPHAPLTAQTPPPRQAPISARDAAELRTFEGFVRQQMAKNKVPGLTIGFIKGDYTWVKGFGYADVENRVPATAASVYRFASVQKSMTAAAILQLAERAR